MRLLNRFIKTVKSIVDPRSISRYVCAIAAVLIFFQSGPVSLASIAIPEQWGKAHESLPGQNGRTIVLIQEAHAVYSVQKAISEILKSLISKQNLKLILVEGGWDDMSLSHLRKSGTIQSRYETASDYFRKGMISGEEYINLISDAPLQLWGIEDPEAYAENMEVFLRIYPNQSLWLEEVSKTLKQLEALADKKISGAPKNFYRSWKAFQHEEISVISYLQAIFHVSPEAARTSPELRTWAAFLGQGGFQIERAPVEKNSLVRALSGILSKQEFDGQDFSRETTVRPEDELGQLKKLLRLYDENRAKLAPVQISNLRSYAEALEQSLSSDAGSLFKGLDQVERQILSQINLTEEQGRIWDALSALYLLQKTVKLELGPEDFSKVDAQNWDEQFSELKNLSFDHKNLPDFALLQKALSEASIFYRSARKREQAMIKNTVQKAGAGIAPVTALIVGGFHTGAIKQALHREGYTVITVQPNVVVSALKNDQRQYFEILKNKWESHTGRGTSVPATLSSGGRS